jgi:hypothetical protein
MTLVFVLLVIYQIKHLLADYPLQTKYMLGKFKEVDWELPLVAHAAVHGAFTFVIATVVAGWQMGLVLGVLDYCIHFVMDRIKASPNLMGRWKPLTAEQYLDHESQIRDGYLVARAKAKIRGNTYFWWALGFDQMVHHLTHYLIIYVLVTR